MHYYELEDVVVVWRDAEQSACPFCAIALCQRTALSHDSADQARQRASVCGLGSSGLGSNDLDPCS